MSRRPIDDLLPAYLGRQRWFAGPPPDEVVVAERRELAPGLEWLLVDAGTARYQVVVGYRPADAPPDGVAGHEAAVLGRVGDELAFDATLDPHFATDLLHVVVPDEEVQFVRPMGAEQSNTSLVFDERLVLKLFRRLQPGPNPDVEITTALATAGFTSVAAPVGVWREDEVDLAVCTPYLAGGTEGWALALTSLRDFYAAEVDDPASAGGDFAAESGRIGHVTAEMHLGLARAFGSQPADPVAWASLVEAQVARLEPDDVDAVAVKDFVERLRAVTSAGVAVRVHGDYHLGQVMRTDTGWYVLDFEGEPARPVHERRVPSSPLKDVAGMLRSLQYAAASAAAERDEQEQERLGPLAEAWERRNRMAFLRGYLGADGIEELLPPAGPDRHAVLAAFELDKAVYEVLYERAHRPDWIEIPRRAVRKLLDG